MVQRAGAGGRTGERPAEVAQLADQQRARHLRPDGGEERVDRGVVERGQRERAADGRGRALGVHVHPGQRGGGRAGEGVHLGLESAQRGDPLGAGLVVGEDGAVDHDDRAPGQERRQLGQRGQAEDAARGRRVLGQVGGPARPGPHHVLGARAVPQQHAGVGVGDRQQLDLQGGDDAEAAPAAAQGPEQVGVGLGVGADELAVGGHDVEGADVVRGEAVAAGVPAEAPAQGVAGHADVGRGAVQGGEAVLGGERHDVVPDRAGADAGGAGDRVDGDLAQAGGPHEHRAGQVVPGQDARRRGRCPGRRRAGRGGGRPGRRGRRPRRSVGTATAAGCWATATFHGVRTASKSSSDASRTRSPRSWRRARAEATASGALGTGPAGRRPRRGGRARRGRRGGRPGGGGGGDRTRVPPGPGAAPWSGRLLRRASARAPPPRYPDRVGTSQPPDLGLAAPPAFWGMVRAGSAAPHFSSWRVTS